MGKPGGWLELSKMKCVHTPLPLLKGAADHKELISFATHEHPALFPMTPGWWPESGVKAGEWMS